MPKKATFNIVVICKGREADYYDFWKRHVNVNSAGEKLHSALLSFTEMIEAKNKNEAHSLIRRKYPEHQIDEQATVRLGT